jgi:hypothetical protein
MTPGPGPLSFLLPGKSRCAAVRQLCAYGAAEAAAASAS